MQKTEEQPDELNDLSRLSILIKSDNPPSREFVSTFNQREAEFTNLIQEAYPEAINVPTRAVYDNLAFIQKRGSCTIWEQAPEAVRGAAPQVSPGYRPPTLPPATPPKTTLFHSADRPTNVTPK